MADTSAIRAADADAEPVQTLAEQAYRSIRRDIVAGRLAPGQPMRFEFLKETYGLSFSPLREALARLQSERLVTAHALRGFRVADMSLDEMWDTIETRILIEREALQTAIARGDDDWEIGVVSAFHALSHCSKRLRAAGDWPSETAIEEIERRHQAFHRALIAACPSRWVRELAEMLYVQTERYRRPVLMRAGAAPDDEGAAPGGRDIEAEHRAIMDAAIGRDTEAAITLLAAHLRDTGRLIERLGIKAG
ncbi:GntR family transcriptional regulator [Tistrella bauzanensis]|jgi:DNA-binding GntR family transcriptional regulator|uniref:GntR family transcriptional regulator n=1 Tax=Tistrella bauzanensis TaxID=657419 RepID=A0ABQ1J0B9_9PROT|nr:GntR family transcriptional regulator [Tistrella bauzanensis]GGB55622.1 GntR family transcriptional regulator [Tistrella bauzanensis]